MVFRCIISFLTVASECTKGIMQSSTQPNFLKMVWNWNIHQRYNLIKDDDWWHQLFDTRLFYLSQTKTNFWWHRQLHLSVEFTGQILKFTPCLELYKLEAMSFWADDSIWWILISLENCVYASVCLRKFCTLEETVLLEYVK